jgi:predicted RNase H-like nuclease
MPRKHHKPEEIVAKLRQVDVLTSQGKSVADAIRERTPAMFAGAFASFRVNGVRLTIAAEQQDEDE